MTLKIKSLNKRINLRLKLYKNVVPKTVNNFIKLIPKYKNCPIHRIEPNFVIQGGDYELQNGRGGKSIYGNNFEDENFILKHDRIGTLSMANSGPNTNGSQFFVTLDKTEHLDNKHVVFGYVSNYEDLDVFNYVQPYDLIIENIKIIK